MFQGTFEEAKAKAVEDGKWLVSHYIQGFRVQA